MKLISPSSWVSLTSKVVMLQLYFRVISKVKRELKHNV
jgi:hypothetical protein